MTNREAEFFAYLHQIVEAMNQGHRNTAMLAVQEARQYAIMPEDLHLLDDIVYWIEASSHRDHDKPPL